MNSIEENKKVVRRFNREIIEQGNAATFKEIMHEDFINRTAPPEANDANGVWNTINNVLRVAFSDLKVEILDQIGEGDKVTSRKVISGVHTGTLMGIPPTNRKIAIDVIDIVTVKDGKYFEHWGINTLLNVVNELKKVSGP